MSKEIALEVVKTTPPVTVSGLTLMGVPLNEWVYVLTLIWLSMQIGGWLYDKIKKRRAK